jgi:hypothetical protein
MPRTHDAPTPTQATHTARPYAHPSPDTHTGHVAIMHRYWHFGAGAGHASVRAPAPYTGTDPNRLRTRPHTAKHTHSTTRTATPPYRRSDTYAPVHVKRTTPRYTHTHTDCVRHATVRTPRTPNHGPVGVRTCTARQAHTHGTRHATVHRAHAQLAPMTIPPHTTHPLHVIAQQLTIWYPFIGASGRRGYYI